jgi:hypothetical protein
MWLGKEVKERDEWDEKGMSGKVKKILQEERDPICCNRTLCQCHLLRAPGKILLTSQRHYHGVFNLQFTRQHIYASF